MVKQTLEATGTSDSVNMLGNSNLSVIYTLTGVSGSVVVSVEGSHDNSTFVNLDENGSTTITADGTYGFTFSQGAFSDVRFNWESGTATSIVVTYQFTGD